MQQRIIDMQQRIIDMQQRIIDMQQRIIDMQQRIMDMQQTRAVKASTATNMNTNTHTCRHAKNGFGPFWKV